MMSTTPETATPTSTPSGFSKHLLFLAVAAAVFVSAFFKIADLDFWWHLKTGQITVESRSIVRTEIYSYSAPGREYIDHEWGFQVIQFLLFQLWGAAGVIFGKISVIASIYLLLLRYMLKEKIPPLMIFFVLLLSICGARIRFIERPEIFTTLFLVITYIAIDSFLKRGSKAIYFLPPLYVLWANIHAAVIVGLVFQCLFLAGAFIDRYVSSKGEYPATYFDRQKSPHDFRKRFGIQIALLIVCTAATLINPFGYRVLTVPFELTSIIDSGLLNNEEWRQPPPLQLPLFYVCLLFALIVSAINFRRLHVVNFLILAFLSYISLKYVRNVGIFSMMMPLLVTPYVAQTFKNRILLPAAALTLAVLWLFALRTDVYEWGIGEASYFPDKIVRFTQEQNLQGNMLNSYAFGGYLIWKFYPERKIFIDGRNEVYLPLLKTLKEVNADGRKWFRFIDQYRIEYALLNYYDELEDVTIIGNDKQVTKTVAPFSSTHFPRKSWSLVYWDDDGMVLVRRSGANQHLTKLEYTSIFPEGNGYQEFLLKNRKLDPAVVASEIARKLQQDPDSERARRIQSISQQYTSR